MQRLTHQHDVAAGRRLLERLQERTGRVRIHRIRSADYCHFLRCDLWCLQHELDQRANSLDANLLAGSFRRKPAQVRVRHLGSRLAASVVDQAQRQCIGQRRFAPAAGTVNQQRMGELCRRQRCVESLIVRPAGCRPG